MTKRGRGWSLAMKSKRVRSALSNHDIGFPLVWESNLLFWTLAVIPCISAYDLPVVRLILFSKAFIILNPLSFLWNVFSHRLLCVLFRFCIAHPLYTYIDRIRRSIGLSKLKTLRFSMQSCGRGLGTEHRVSVTVWTSTIEDFNRVPTLVEFRSRFFHSIHM